MNDDQFAQQLMAAEKTDDQLDQSYRDNVQRLLSDRLVPTIRLALTGVAAIVGVSSVKLWSIVLATEFSSWTVLSITVAILGAVSSFISIGLLLIVIRGRFHRYRNGMFVALVAVASLVVVGLLCLLGIWDANPQIRGWITLSGIAFIVSAFVIAAMTWHSWRRLTRRIRVIEDEVRRESKQIEENREQK